MDFFEVGKVIGFHGLKGELKITPFTETPERFEEIEKVYIDNKIYKVEKVRIQKGKVFLFLEGIKDRTEAEKFKDKILSIDEEDTEPLEEDEFYIAELIGLKVFDKDQNQIGVLTGVTQSSGPVNTFVITTEGKDILVPALKEYLEIIRGDKIIADIPEELMEL